MESITVVLANGVIEDFPLIRRRLESVQVDSVLAADGGIRHAADLGLHVDLIVGDLDSIPTENEKLSISAKLERHPAQKDETDLELALQAALDHSAARVVVLGATGGRLDMTIGNTILLALPAFKDRRIELWHNRQTVWLIRPPGDEITGQPGDTLSLIPLGGGASGITLENMLYPLQDGALAFGPLRGISNRLETDSAYVSIKSGLLLAIHSPGTA